MSIRNKIFTIAPILSLIILSCAKSPTEHKTGTITGTVYLEGEQDHSNITVALYPVR